MAQFTLHDNANPQTRVAYPYLMDVQADPAYSLKYAPVRICRIRP